MPWIDPQEQNTAYEAVQSVGPVAQTAPYGLTGPATIASGSSWTSNVIPSDGFKVLAIGCTSTQPGQITITRYLDVAGTVALGSNAMGTITAGTPQAVTVSDGLPFASFKLNVSNTGGSAATVTNFGVLMSAA